jgi:putative ABC transport system permease protein
MDAFQRDLRFFFRALRKQPGFAVAAVLTLALGIGANVAVFSAVHGVLLRPLPYPEADRLAVLWANWASEDVPRVSHTGGDVLDYQRESRSFEGIAALGSIRQNLTGGDEPLQVQVGWVSRNFFSVLGVQPVLGRDFAPDEGPGSVLLSHDLWRRDFGGDQGILGRSVQLDGRPYTVIGVLPRGFRLHLSADAGISTDIDAWKPPDEAGAPLRWITSELKLSTLRVLGRLRPGVTIAQARADMDGIAERLRARYPDHAAVGFHLAVEPLHQEVVGHVRPTLLILQGAVALVLLIACTNVANLLLVRAQNRQREIALRLSLGGSFGRIARQMLTESLVLAVLGGALGLLLAQGAIRLLVALGPVRIPRLDSLGIHGPVLAFTLGATLLATLLAGLLPALRLRRWNLSGILQQQSEQARGGEVRLSKLLIAAEVAVSLVLLLGTGLLVRSFVRLEEIRPGFDTHNLLTFSVSVPGVRYRGPVEAITFLKRFESELSSLPGVASVSAVWPLPFEGQIWYGPYRAPDNPPKGDTPPLSDYRVIAADYPATIGARLLAGRTFEETDTNAVLIDQRMAERNWPGRSALGRTLFASPVGREMEMRVVGVVENIRHQDLRADGRETVYLPAHRWTRPDQEIAFVVRTATDPRSLVAPVRQVLRSLDPQLPMDKVRLMDDYIADAVAPNRLALAVMLVFALVALVLASVGLYGVVAYALSRRTREIGIRVALGARRSEVFAGALREGMLPTLLGIAVGIAGSFLALRVLSGLLVGVGARDPWTYAATTGLLLLVALAACCLPARRAVRVDPTVAIRQE